MQLKELKLRNYRLFKDLTFKPMSNVSVLTGKNAQGKTSILEALYLCATGRSHRTAKDKELIKFGEHDTNVVCNVEKAIGLNKIELFLSTTEKKKISINGAEISKLGELMGKINCVMFSYDDIKLIKEGPQERRKFIDIAISQLRPAYFYNLQQYNKILNQRNTLLKEIQKKESLKKTLYVWNERIALTGASITFDRYKFFNKMTSLIENIHKDISGTGENLVLSYKPSVPAKDLGIEQLASKILEILIKSESDDIRKGYTGFGCHKDDFAPMLNGMDLRAYGSSGQQRTALLSVKFAEIFTMKEETDEYPVLLIDDCLSELEKYRQQSVFDMIKEFNAIITSTDAIVFPDKLLKIAEIIKVDSGKLSSY